MRALLLIALAGCESGIAIEVRAPAGTEEVALFLATSACDECTPIRPPFADFVLDGSFYDLDGASIAAPVDDSGSAWFRFQPGALDSSFEIVLAVGLLPVEPAASYRRISSSMLITDLDVAGPRQVVIQLDPQTDAEQHALVWESPQTNVACAAYVPESATDAVVIVPAGNFDCDSVEGTADCDPFTHETNVSTPALEEATCLSPRSVAGLEPGISYCMIGGESPCSAERCVSTNYCAPIAACEPCMAPTKFGCISALRESAKIVCDFPVVRDAAADRFEVCDRDSTLVSLPLPQCSSFDLAIVAPNEPPVFGDKVEWETGMAGLLAVVAKVPDPRPGACEVEVDIEGSYEDLLFSGLAVPLVAKIDVEGLPVEGAVIPMLLKPVLVNDGENCESSPLQVTCRYEGGIDSVSACLGLASP